MKYDWIALEKEFILSDNKTVSSFLKDKGIKVNGSTKKNTKGWKEKKVLKEDKKSTKILEKVIEKEAEQEAKEIVNINSIADQLALKIIEATEELDRYVAKKTTKHKSVVYDEKTKKPKEEKTEEIEELTDYKSIINKKGLNLLARALKDLNDIKNNSRDTNGREISNIQNLMIKIKEVADDADTD